MPYLETSQFVVVYVQKEHPCEKTANREEFDFLDFANSSLLHTRASHNFFLWK